MAKRRLLGWSAVGLAFVALAGCDQINSRMAQLGKLVGQVQDQLAGKGQPAQPGQPAQSGDALDSAPIEARALAGVQVAPANYVQAASIEDRLRTESFFAIGSVIAKPKEQIEEAAVDPEEFSVEEAQGSGAPTTAEVSPSPAPPPPPVTAPTSPGAASPNNDLRVRPPAMTRTLPRAVVRDRLRIDQKALEEAVKQAEVPVTEEAVQEAKQVAEQTLRINTRNARQMGDDVVRRAQRAEKPVPRQLSVRTQLNVDRALAARERTFQRLEQLGLSGSVEPEANGAMKITIGVSPTQLSRRPIDPEKLAQMRQLFASDKDRPQQTCTTMPDQAALKADPVLATECAIKLLRDSGDYEYVEKDYIFTHTMLRRPKNTPVVTNTPAPSSIFGAPNDPLYSLQWPFRDFGTAAGQSAGGAGFGTFWQRAHVTGSKKVTVAVVDTGLQMNHPDIRAATNIAPGWDMVSNLTMANDGDGPDADPNDPGDRCDLTDPESEDTYHGTHVAGTIGAGATNNGVGVAGGAWEVTIVPVRALGRCGGSLSDINNAIRWAAGVAAARDSAGEPVYNAHPADIINLSIGLFAPCPASMQAAINDAVAAGAIVVAAAGNDRVDTKWYAPGGCDNVISVAAGNALGEIAPYSNFGDKVTMLAPGGDMTRDDDHDGRPDGILSTRLSHNCYDPVTKANVAECYYSYEQGTSMAAPHVSAALALLKTKYPEALPSKLREMLMQSTSSRTALQCAGKCSEYPDTTALPGQPGMCARPCGGRILNLGNAPLQ